MHTDKQLAASQNLCCRYAYKTYWDFSAVRIDLNKCNVSKDLAQDRHRLEWQNRIYVTDPNIVGGKALNDD